MHAGHAGRSGGQWSGVHFREIDEELHAGRQKPAVNPSGPLGSIDGYALCACFHSLDMCILHLHLPTCEMQWAFDLHPMKCSQCTALGREGCCFRGGSDRQFWQEQVAMNSARHTAQAVFVTCFDSCDSIPPSPLLRLKSNSVLQISHRVKCFGDAYIHVLPHLEKSWSCTTNIEQRRSFFNIVAPFGLAETCIIGSTGL